MLNKSINNISGNIYLSKVEISTFEIKKEVGEMYRREEVEFSDKPIYRDKRDLLTIVEVPDLLSYDIVAYLEVPFENEQRYVPLYQKRGEA